MSLGCIRLLNTHGTKWQLNAFHSVSITRANPRAELVIQLNLQAVCPYSSGSVAWDVIYQIIWAFFKVIFPWGKKNTVGMMQRYFTAFNNKRSILNKFTDTCLIVLFMVDVFILFCGYFH